jgi:hypothetical protein
VQITSFFNQAGASLVSQSGGRDSCFEIQPSTSCQHRAQPYLNTGWCMVGLVHCNRNSEHQLNQRAFLLKQEQRFAAECAGFLMHRKQGYALNLFPGSGKEGAYSARSLRAIRREESASAVQKKIEKEHSRPKDGAAIPLIQKVMFEKGFTSSEAEVPLTRKLRVERGPSHPPKMAQAQAAIHLMSLLRKLAFAIAGKQMAQ